MAVTWSRLVLDTIADVSDFTWVLDEDDMVSDSDEKLATQQSIKAYVDSQSGAAEAVAFAFLLGG